MSRLFDRIIVEKSLSEEVRNIVKQSLYFVGDNVAAYYYSGTDQEYWDHRDFPNVTPPTANFFIDFKPPSKIVSEKYGVVPWHSELRPYTWGIHNLAFDLETIDPVHSIGWVKYFLGPLDDLEDVLYRTKHDIRWVVESCLFAEMEKEKPMIFWAWRWFVSPNGELVDPLDSGRALMAVNVPKIVSGIPMPSELEVHTAIGVLPFLHCEWLFLSFLHTKNTFVITVKPPDKLKKKAERKRGIEIHEYQMLEIQPLKDLLESEGRAKEVGLRRALHICRGHFRDYRKHGLFGKYKGIFWFDTHLRGRWVKKKDNKA